MSNKIIDIDVEIGKYYYYVGKYSIKRVKVINILMDSKRLVTLFKIKYLNNRTYDTVSYDKYRFFVDEPPYWILFLEPNYIMQYNYLLLDKNVLIDNLNKFYFNKIDINIRRKLNFSKLKI